MFSSLPSASKIYVSSTKPKQKGLNSAKKKRKKVITNAVCTPINVHEEETLVSSTSLRKLSSSELSFNSHEESIEAEVNCNNDEHLNFDVKSIHEKKIVESDFENEDFVLNNLQKLNDQDQESFDAVKPTENASDLVSNNVYCDETTQTNNENISVENDNLVAGADTDDSIFISPPYENNAVSDISCNQTGNLVTEQDSSPVLNENTSDDCHELESNEFARVTHENVENMCDSGAISEQKFESNSNLINQKDNCEENNSVSFTLAEDMEPQNIVSSEISHTEVKERKDSLGINMVSDILDSSSVRSDCCVSTDLYDIHVDNSEHSSVDENHNSNHDDCRIHSPEQSEVSCTESVMYDSKIFSQSESALRNFPILTEEDNDKYGISHEDVFDQHNLPKNILDKSYSFTNLQKSKSKYLQRSLSLPENFYNFKCNESPCVNKSINFDRSLLHKNQKESNKYFYTEDKATFTTDECTVMSNKSTITSDTDYAFDFKKDVATTPIKVNLPLSENVPLKDHKSLIMKVLPPVAVMQARARSYVFGSIGSTGSLLGNEELSRFFPDNKVTVFVGTWNMNGHDPPKSIDDFLLPLDVSSVPDIYAIGVQESMQSRSEWEILLQTTLGPSHVLFASTSFGVLHLCIFMRRDLIWFCSEPEEANIATRPGSMIKTKGAVAICFMFFGTSFLFVNSHLTAHEQKLKERLSDYEKICSALDLPKVIPMKSYQKDKDVTSRFDCVFWSGDLNFRVMQDRPSVLSFVEENIRKPDTSCNSLMQHDQLCQAMAKGVAFHGFKEGFINFIPSYKFDVGTSCFDSTKQRVPSYTDRILYRCKDKSSIVCKHYNAVPGIFTSDHKPVFAVFNVSVKPGRDNIPLAAGLFKRDIYLEAIKRRAQQLEVSRNHKQSTVCNVM